MLIDSYKNLALDEERDFFVILIFFEKRKFKQEAKMLAKKGFLFSKIQFYYLKKGTDFPKFRFFFPKTRFFFLKLSSFFWKIGSFFCIKGTDFGLPFWLKEAAFGLK